MRDVSSSFDFADTKRPRSAIHDVSIWAPNDAGIYEKSETMTIPWMNIFPWSHQIDDSTVEDYIGISMGADGFFSGVEIRVKEEGMVVEVKSKISDSRTNLNNRYQPRMLKAAVAMGNQVSTEQQREEATLKYNRLHDRKTAELKHISAMKNEKGENWPYCFLRIRMESEVAPNIVDKRVEGNAELGKVLSLDLRVKQKASFVEAAIATLSTSPTK